MIILIRNTLTFGLGIGDVIVFFRGLGKVIQTAAVRIHFLILSVAEMMEKAPNNIVSVALKWLMVVLFYLVKLTYQRKHTLKKWMELQSLLRVNVKKIRPKWKVQKGYGKNTRKCSGKRIFPKPEKREDETVFIRLLSKI